MKRLSAAGGGIISNNTLGRRERTRQGRKVIPWCAQRGRQAGRTGGWLAGRAPTPCLPACLHPAEPVTSRRGDRSRRRVEDEWGHAGPPAVSRGDRTGGHCAGTRQTRREDGTKKVCGCVWVKLGEWRWLDPLKALRLTCWGGRRGRCGRRGRAGGSGLAGTTSVTLERRA